MRQKTKVGEYILAYLHKNNLTQKQLCEMISRPQKAISDIINGKKAISLQSALDLERATGVNALNWLIEDIRERLQEERKYYNPKPLKAPSPRIPRGGKKGHGKINRLKQDILSDLESGLKISDISKKRRISDSGIIKALERWGVNSNPNTLNAETLKAIKDFGI